MVYPEISAGTQEGRYIDRRRQAGCGRVKTRGYLTPHLPRFNYDTIAIPFEYSMLRSLWSPVGILSLMIRMMLKTTLQSSIQLSIA